jgi:hypothetical protein
MMRPSVLLLLLTAAVSAYGFLASFEPSPRAAYFRVGYAVVGLLCLACLAALYTRRPH